MKQKRVLLFVIMFLFLAACGTNEEEATPTPETAVAPESDIDTDGEEATTEVTSDDTEVETTADEERVTVRFAVYDWEQGRYEELAESFEEANPGIAIELVSLNETLELGSFGGGGWPEDADVRLASAADVISNINLQGASRQGIILDLTPFFENDGRISQDDFYPQALESFQWEGGLWAMPTELNYSLIFYDKDAFDTANVPYPEAGWTWDDFLAAAQALTVRDGDEVTQWGFVEQFPSPLDIVQGIAGPIVNEEAEPPTIRLEETAVQDAVAWYTDLFLVHEVSPILEEPEPNSSSPPEGYQLIEEGKAAMWPDFSSSFAFRSQQANLGAAPYPVGPDNENTSPLRLFSGLSISAGTNKPDEAWQWIVYLSQQAQDQGFGFGPTSLPVRRSVAEASGFWDEIDPELASALAFAVEHPFVTSSAPNWSYAAFNEAIDAILAGEQTVTDALAEAQTEMEAARDEALATAEEVETTDIVVAETEEEERDPNAVSITFLAGGTLDMQGYRELAQQFEETHPDIIVEVKQPFFNGPVEFTDIAADSDCFQWSPSFDNEENLAAILSLEPFLDNDPTMSKDDFFPAVMDSFTYQGQVWGIPGQVVVTVIEYNKDLFDAASIPYPTNDWTTEDFLDTAVALTQGEGEEKQYGFVPETFELQDMMYFIERQGAQLLDDSVDPPTVGFDNPATIEAVRWFSSLTTEYGVKPVFTTSFTNVTTSDFEDRQAMIDNELAAMWTGSGIGGIVVLGGGEEEEEEVDEQRLGAVPLPVGPNGERIGGYQSASGFFISSHTEARQACWEWIKFVSENPVETAVQALPARISVAESDTYIDTVGQERANAYLASVTSATQPSFFERFTSQDSWLGISFVWLTNAYDQILNEGIPVEEALATAQETAEAYRACIIAQDAFTDQEAQQECVREVDDSLPDYLFGG